MFGIFFGFMEDKHLLHQNNFVLRNFEEYFSRLIAPPELVLIASIKSFFIF